MINFLCYLNEAVHDLIPDGIGLVGDEHIAAGILIVQGIKQ